MMKRVRAFGFALVGVLACSSPSFARESLTVSTPWDTALQAAPFVRYTQASVFGEGAVPSYKGFAYGGEFDYTIGTTAFAMGPYFSIAKAKLQNTANNSDQKENLDATFATLGVKIYTSFTYLKLGLTQAKVQDNATGTINNSKSYKSNGLELAAGVSYSFTDYMSTSLGLDLAYFKFDANTNNLANRLDYVSYGLNLSVRFALPSGKSDLY